SSGRAPGRSAADDRYVIHRSPITVSNGRFPASPSLAKPIVLRKWGQFPSGPFVFVNRPRQLHQHRGAGWVEPVDEIDEVLFRHSGTSHGWPIGAAPDVKKNTGA